MGSLISISSQKLRHMTHMKFKTSTNVSS